MFRHAGGDWDGFENDPGAMELLREGEKLEQARKTREAITVYERVMDMSPGAPRNAAIEFRIADIYNYIRNDSWTPDQQEAKRRYEEIVSTYERTRAEVVRSNMWLGAMHARDGDLEKAREYGEAVADANRVLDSQPETFRPTDAEWVERLAPEAERLIADVDRQADSKAISRQIQQAGGDWADFLDDPEAMELIREAEALENEHRTQEAIELYEQAMRLNPGSDANAAIEFRIADIYNYIMHENWSPDTEEAKRRYEEIVDTYPHTRGEVLRSHKWVGQIYAREQNYGKAREHYEAISDARLLLETRPEMFHEIDALWIELLNQDIEQRLTSLDQRMERERSPKPPPIPQEVGALQVQHGDPSPAEISAAGENHLSNIPEEHAVAVEQRTEQPSAAVGAAPPAENHTLRRRGLVLLVLLGGVASVTVIVRRLSA